MNSLLCNDVIICVFDVHIVDVENLRELKKWACVCKLWSKTNIDWYNRALTESRYFLHSQFKFFCAKKDINTIVCGMDKYIWDDETANECVWHLHKFMLTPTSDDSDSDDSDSDDSDSDLELVEDVTNQETVLNINEDDYLMTISIGDDLDEFGAINYDKVATYVNFSSEKLSNDKNKAFVMEFEGLTQFCCEATYNYQNNIYDSIHTNKNDFLESMDLHGVTSNLDLCEHIIEHIELVSQSDIVRVSINFLRQFRDKNMMRCSAAFRLLMKLFSNPKSREQISSKEYLEEILLTVKICKRWEDVDSGFRLMMAICENNDDLIPFFLENGGLDFFTYINDENHTICSYLEFSGFIFKLYSKQTVTNTSPVISLIVLKVLFEASIRCMQCEQIMHSFSRTMYCLSSNITNRQNMNKFDGINIVNRMIWSHKGNDIIKENALEIISRLRSTI